MSVAARLGRLRRARRAGPRAAAATQARAPADLGFLGRYDGLTLHVQRGGGARVGERRFPGSPQPSGIETESFTAYAPGDDLRHLDWNAVGRLDSLLIRRFTAEREVAFHVLVDTSASMDAPARDGKLARARELALVLSYLALATNDAVRLTPLGATPQAPPTVFRQRRSAVRIAAILDALVASGSVALGAALVEHARRHPDPGIAFVLSDFMMDPSEIATGVQALRARGYTTTLLQVVGASELDPARLFTRGMLEDVESGATHPIVLTPATLAAYRQVLAEHFDALAALAARLGARYLRVDPDAGVQAFVTGPLARIGLVRRR